MTLENKARTENLLDIRRKEGSSQYTGSLETFFESNGIVAVNLPKDERIVYCFREGTGNIHELIIPGTEYHFVAKTENSSTGKLLQSPEFIENFFGTRGLKAVEPRSIINQSGTTLFISAGVQILEDVMYQEKVPFQERLFVAQPVFRTQFMDSVAEGSSTSFINVCTELVNQLPEAHFESLKIWFEFLQELGFKRSLFFFAVDEKETKWGDKNFTQRRIKVYYGGLEIGDAIYVDNFPQRSRDALRISDIGFGLERIRWALQGGSYWALIGEGKKNSAKVMDHIRTLALLAGSGLKPHYKSHGYRFRQLSKRLISDYVQGEKTGLNLLSNMFYDQWSVWTDLPVVKNEAIALIQGENVRNFNAELITRLKEHYSDVDVDIYQPTDKVVKLLKGTSANSDHIQQVLRDMGGGIYL